MKRTWTLAACLTAVVAIVAVAGDFVVFAHRRYLGDVYAFRVVLWDVPVTLHAIREEWHSFCHEHGREPASLEEFLAARPSLRRWIQPRVWSAGKPFEIFVPPIEADGVRIIAVSPPVDPIADPLWPSALTERFADKFRAERWCTSEVGLGHISRLPVGWRGER